MGLALFYAACLVWLARHDARFDDRFYAERNAVRLRIVAASPLPLGRAAPISDNGALSVHFALLKGWSVVEPWGVWSTAPDAALAFAVPATHGPLVLRIQAMVMLDHGLQTVAVDVGRRRLGEWTLRDSSAELTVPLPADTIDARGIVTLEVLTRRLVQPTGDERRVGVGLRQLTLSDANPARIRDHSPA